MQHKNHRSISLLLFWKCFLLTCLPLCALPTFLKVKKTFGKLKKRKKRKKRDQSLKNVFYIYGQNRPCGLCRVHGVRCELAFRGLHCPVSSRFRAPASGAVHAGNKRCGCCMRPARQHGRLASLTNSFILSFTRQPGPSEKSEILELIWKGGLKMQDHGNMTGNWRTSYRKRLHNVMSG